MQHSFAGISRDIAIIPTPFSVTRDQGTTVLPYMDRVIENEPHDPACVIAGQLADDIQQATGMRWDIAKGNRWKGFITLEERAGMMKASYRLVITNDGIAVQGGDYEGVRNGAQTLRQIIRQSGPTLPCMTIEDKPAYPIRSYYLDITRGRVPTLDWLKHWADMLCLYKYNQLQLYVEHTFAFDDMSETWRAANPLHPSDIIDFDAYCAQLGIELVPSVSTFGHLYTALRTHELRRLGEFPEDADRPFSFIERLDHHTLNISEPDAFALSATLVDEYLELFTSHTFNICADETFDLGKGRSKPEADRRGIADMYADYVIRLCEHLSAQGRKPQFWGDIAVSMPQILQRLPENVTLLNWLYSPTVDDTKVRLVADSGARQIVCSAVWSWSTFMPYMHKAWNNISRLAGFGLDHGAEGYMVTDWGDCGHINDPRMSVPGMIYGAQYAWNPREVLDMDDMNRMISVAEYGDTAGKAAGLLERASHCSSFSWLDTVEFLELDDGNGSLNSQVLGSVWTGEAESSQRIRASSTLAEARCRMLEWAAPKLKQVQERNLRLEKLIAELGMCIGGARGTAGTGLQPALVMIDGQRLLNGFAWHMAVRAGILDRPVDLPEQSERDLARAIEIWGERYAMLWRQVSRESELDRILHYLWRMADILRS